MLSVETVGVALVGYILGSIPFGVLVAKSNFSPALAAWLPILVFGVLAYGLLNYAKR